MHSKTAGNTGFAVRLAGSIALWVVAAVAAEPRLIWSTPSHARPAASDGGQLPEPVVGDGIVAWTSGRAIHAVRLDDGSPLHHGDSPRESTAVLSLPLLFPEDAPPSDAGLSRPCVRGGRLFTTLSARFRGGEAMGRIVAIDCSPAGGGRIEWYAGLPAGAVGFDGPPWVDGERLLAIVVGEGARAAPRLVAFDLFDGRLLETRPVTTNDRPPESAGPRVAVARGRVVVASDRTIECRADENARP